MKTQRCWHRCFNEAKADGRRGLPGVSPKFMSSHGLRARPFESGVFADATKVRTEMKSSWLGNGLNANESVLRRVRTPRHRPGRRPGKDERQRLECAASRSRGAPGASRSWKRPGRILPRSLLRECDRADTLTLDCWPPDM